MTDGPVAEAPPPPPAEITPKIELKPPTTERRIEEISAMGATLVDRSVNLITVKGRKEDITDKPVTLNAAELKNRDPETDETFMKRLKENNYVEGIKIKKTVDGKSKELTIQSIITPTKDGYTCRVKEGDDAATDVTFTRDEVAQAYLRDPRNIEAIVAELPEAQRELVRQHLKLEGIRNEPTSDGTTVAEDESKTQEKLKKELEAQPAEEIDKAIVESASKTGIATRNQVLKLAEQFPEQAEAIRKLVDGANIIKPQDLQELYKILGSEAVGNRLSSIDATLKTLRASTTTVPNELKEIQNQIRQLDLEHYVLKQVVKEMDTGEGMVKYQEKFVLGEISDEDAAVVSQCLENGDVGGIVNKLIGIEMRTAKEQEKIDLQHKKEQLMKLGKYGGIAALLLLFGSIAMAAKGGQGQH